MDLWCQKLPTASQSLDGPKSVKSFSLEAMKPIDCLPTYIKSCINARQELMLGWEPWSSGYGKRLTFQRSWVWIPAPYTVFTFFTNICCKNCNVCLKRPKINEKEAGIGIIFFKKRTYAENFVYNIRPWSKFSETCLGPPTLTLTCDFQMKLWKNYGEEK